MIVGIGSRSLGDYPWKKTLDWNEFYHVEVADSLRVVVDAMRLTSAKKEEKPEEAIRPLKREQVETEWQALSPAPVCDTCTCHVPRKPWSFFGCGHSNPVHSKRPAHLSAVPGRQCASQWRNWFGSVRKATSAARRAVTCTVTHPGPPVESRHGETVR